MIRAPDDDDDEDDKSRNGEDVCKETRRLLIRVGHRYAGLFRLEYARIYTILLLFDK